MNEAFDVFDYAAYLRRRWRVPLAACCAAVAIALLVSFLLPRRYTATATIVIEAPAGNDVRTATAVSPIYLESLRTYERFAGSDSLFQRAAERFHLQHGSQTIESLKQRVLKVEKLRDTKILEISATLPEPKLAQQVVQFLAGETVNMSRGENLAEDRELADGAAKQEQDARRRLAQAEKTWSENTISEPVEALRSKIGADVGLLAKLRQDLIDAEADAAEYRQPDSRSDTEFVRHQLKAAEARAGVLRQQTEALTKVINDENATLSRRTARRDEVQSELKIAQAAYENAAAHLRDVRAGSGMRGERLRIVDPGIVPERPSSPNIPLNVIVAFFAAAVASLVYVSLTFVWRRNTAGLTAIPPRGMRA